MKDMTGFSGWVWQGYSFSFPERLLLEIKATPITFSAMHSDRITWSSSPSKNFNMKEAYKLVILELDKMYKGNFNGSWIWKVPTIPKIKCFLWQCHHHSIPVRSNLAARGMQVTPLCHFCEVSTETTVHVLRDCCVARNLWSSLLSPMSDSLFFGLHLNDWLRLNCCKMDTYSSSGIRWGILFSFGVWILWLHRNRVLFRNERVQDNLKPSVLAKVVEFAYIGINEKLNTTHRSIQVRWTKPPLSWHKLNLDGSSIGNSGRAGGGGLIRDDKGVWVKGYARNIGHTTSVAAELWALRDGLRLCSALKIPDVIIELDAKLIVDLLQKEEGHQNCIDA